MDSVVKRTLWVLRQNFKLQIESGEKKSDYVRIVLYV